MERDMLASGARHPSLRDGIASVTGGAPGLERCIVEHVHDQVALACVDDRIAGNLEHRLFAARAVRPQMRDAGGGLITPAAIPGSPKASFFGDVPNQIGW